MISRLILTLVAALVTIPALAEAPIPVGSSVLKIDQSEASNPVRMARKELVAVEKEITDLEKQIQVSKSQAASYRGINNLNMASSYDTLTNVYEAKKSDLVVKRRQLQSELKSVK
jgi:conjugal transfer/entry exclusion protein